MQAGTAWVEFNMSSERGIIGIVAAYRQAYMWI